MDGKAASAGAIAKPSMSSNKLGESFGDLVGSRTNELAHHLTVFHEDERGPQFHPERPAQPFALSVLHLDVMNAGVVRKVTCHG